MIEKLPSLAQLCKVLQQVPYLASKNLYRVATYFLVADEQRMQKFYRALQDARINIIPCEICCVWREKQSACVFCSDEKRDISIICVVETWQELLSVEKTDGYRGMYHVLGGAICPLDGISADDLTIGKLLARVTENTKEIILATNQTPEGEATAAYISRKLKQYPYVIVSCLARGVPVGSTLELMDKLTVYKALSERRPF